jgi:hypothetical protein
MRGERISKPGYPGTSDSQSMALLTARGPCPVISGGSRYGALIVCVHAQDCHLVASARSSCWEELTVAKLNCGMSRKRYTDRRHVGHVPETRSYIQKFGRAWTSQLKRVTCELTQHGSSQGKSSIILHLTHRAPLVVRDDTGLDGIHASLHIILECLDASPDAIWYGPGRAFPANHFQPFVLCAIRHSPPHLPVLR